MFTAINALKTMFFTAFIHAFSLLMNFYAFGVSLTPRTFCIFSHEKNRAKKIDFYLFLTYN